MHPPLRSVAPTGRSHGPFQQPNATGYTRPNPRITEKSKENIVCKRYKRIDNRKQPVITALHTNCKLSWRVCKHTGGGAANTAAEVLRQKLYGCISIPVKRDVCANKQHSRELTNTHKTSSYKILEGVVPVNPFQLSDLTRVVRSILAPQASSFSKGTWMHALQMRTLRGLTRGPNYKMLRA